MNALDLIYGVGAAALFPIWARKSRSGWKQRLGHTAPLPPKDPARPRVLIHAVSVGEVSAARGLVEQLRARDLEVVVATTTDTGMARATAIFTAGPFAAAPITIVRYPLDFSASVRQFLDSVQPDLVALMELEVWPNFVAACRTRAIPIGVVNGRLSARSFRGYRRIRPAIAKSFASLAFAAVQDSDYAERFIHMGLPAERCTMTGTMKWDAVPPESSAQVSTQARSLAFELGLENDRLIVVAGSTAEGEEELLCQAMLAVNASENAQGRPNVQIICAPRKPQRFDQAATALPGCIRRSASKGRITRVPKKSDLYLLDTLGELGLCYQLADIVVIGRTFVPLGGSDPMEPAGLGKPLVCGPHMTNFSTVATQLAHTGGLLMVRPSELAATLSQLITDPQRREAMASANIRCVDANRGATRRTADLLVEVVAKTMTHRKQPITPPAAG